MGMTLGQFAAWGGRIRPGLRATIPSGLVVSAEDRRELIQAYRAAKDQLDTDEAFGSPSQGDAAIVLAWEVFDYGE